VVDIAKGPAEAFSPLKAILASISILCEKYQVCFYILFKAICQRSCLQNTAAVKDKIEILLSRIASLEKLFEQPAGNEKESKRREGVLMYAISLCSGQTLIPALVNSRVSKNNCRCWMRSLWLCSTSIMLKTVKMLVDSLMTYGRWSMTTWSVHHCDTLPNN